MYSEKTEVTITRKSCITSVYIDFGTWSLEMLYSVKGKEWRIYISAPVGGRGVVVEGSRSSRGKL